MMKNAHNQRNKLGELEHTNIHLYILSLKNQVVFYYKVKLTQNKKKKIYKKGVKVASHASHVRDMPSIHDRLPNRRGQRTKIPYARPVVHNLFTTCQHHPPDSCRTSVRPRVAVTSPGQRPHQVPREQLRRAEVRQVAFRVQHLDRVLASEMVLQVCSDRSRHRHVPGGLNYAAGDLHHAQDPPQIAVENGPRHEKCYIGPHVEQGPAELPHGRRHVGAHRERREPLHPRHVIPLHRHEELLDLPDDEPSMVAFIVQEPATKDLTIRFSAFGGFYNRSIFSRKICTCHT